MLFFKKKQQREREIQEQLLQIEEASELEKEWLPLQHKSPQKNGSVSNIYPRDGNK